MIIKFYFYLDENYFMIILIIIENKNDNLLIF